MNAVAVARRLFFGRTGSHSAIQLAKPWWSRVGILFWICFAWVIGISLTALFAPILPIQDPLANHLTHQYAPMFSDGYILGADGNGRDMLARTITGARISLQLAYTAPFISLFFGLVLGLSAGYFRGRVDSVVSIFIDSILAFPNIVAIMAILFYAGSTMFNMILVFGFFGIPIDTRIARANTIMFAERDFVAAARAQGASHFRIIIRELLPNVIIPLASLLLFGMSFVIVIEGIISFLGLGIPPPTPTWGKMISDGFEDISLDPHITFVPAGFMFMTILSFNVLGDRLRSLTDVKGSAV
jgi:peptide/nickel transport system permease protein